MGIIRRLDPTIANKIAAGEVIESLANVVKELVENSLDAEATKIDIELTEAGMKMIKVSDNGIGMDFDDALLAFERHATSKIKTVNDLFRIQSLGFRGEALPSIASISRVNLLTGKDEAGINIIYEDGKLVDKHKVWMNQGTIIEVTKLFYSTPARFKYLKSVQYELSKIVALINGFALANPQVSFRLFNDKKQLLVTRNNESITNIMAQIYGVQAANSLIYFENKNRDYHIYGYTSNPIVNRSNQSYITIVVNNRVVSNKEITKSIVESYDQLIPKNRYPITIMYVEVDPLLIDVNIHPRKQEIKFSEREKLQNLIKSTLLEKLEITNIYQKPDDDFSQTKMKFFEEEPSEYKTENIKSSAEPEKKPVQKRYIPDLEYIGQFAGTYLVWQNEEGLFLLDQHAAAERIRYEKYLNKWHASNQESVEILIPLKIELNNEIALRLEEKVKDFKELGLDVKVQNESLYVNKIPNWFPRDYEEIYVEAVALSLANEEKVAKKTMIDDLAKLLACKHSLKANHYISSLEANQLLSDLRKCERPFTCPHGRPIIVDISMSQIEHWFNRVI
jgi:DNA mismatch repair protein MutL